MAGTIPGAGITTPLTLTTADNLDQLTLVSTDGDANTGPILKLLRDSGSPADNDLCAVIKLNGDNDANEDTQCYEIRAAWNDVSNGTEDGAVRHALMVGGTLRDVMTLDSGIVVFNEDSQDIDFRVESSANANCFKIDAGALSGQGAVGIGDINTSRVFNITTPSSYSQFGMSLIQASSSAPYGIYINYSGAAPDSGSDYAYLDFEDTSAGRFRVYSDGDVVNHDNSYGAISDERVKQNIVDAGSQWDDIKNIKVKKFKMKDDVRQYGEDKATVHIGLVAQEAKTISPGLIEENKPSKGDIISDSSFGTEYTAEDQEVKDGEKEVGDVKEVKENVLVVKYSVLYMKAIKALQEAMARIEALESK